METDYYLDELLTMTNGFSGMYGWIEVANPNDCDGVGCMER